MRVGGMGPTDCLAPGSMFVPNNVSVNHTNNNIIKFPNDSGLHYCWDKYWRRSFGFGNWSLGVCYIYQGPAAAAEISIPKLFRKPTLLFNKTV